MKAKKPSESLAITTKVVLPNETNTLGKLFGGALLAWMDEIAAVSAHRHAKQVVVTSSVNHVSFDIPVDLGAFVTLEAKVSRAFRSSMEVVIDVSVEDRETGESKMSNQAIYTFVAVNKEGKSVEVPPIEPETEEEQRRYDAALRRKQLSLILAGKMEPDAATELKALFAK
ncbi:MAG: acyl-CoA thioesterase [Flavobacteriales bacterium]|jgi:acyl-CoA hydrolase|nr:acyl-CoA thioesterase [Flavobacteriales bacterium]